MQLWIIRHKGRFLAAFSVFSDVQDWAEWKGFYLNEGNYTCNLEKIEFKEESGE